MWLLFLRPQSYGLDIRKTKLCCCVGTENYVALLLKFILQVYPLIWLKTGTWPYCHLRHNFSLLRCSCTSLLQARARISDTEYTVSKRRALNFNFQVILEYMKLQKKTLSTLQMIKTKRTANCSHPIISAVIYHTSKSTIMYGYRVLFTVIVNCLN